MRECNLNPNSAFLRYYEETRNCCSHITAVRDLSSMQMCSILLNKWVIAGRGFITIVESVLETSKLRDFEILTGVINTSLSELEIKELEDKERSSELANVIFCQPRALLEAGLFRAQSFICNAIRRFQDVFFEKIEKDYSSNVMYHSVNRRFPVQIINILSDSFSSDPFPSAKELVRLCEVTQLGERQVTMWFTNRRCRFKKRKREIDMTDESPSDTDTHSPPNSPRSKLHSSSLPPLHPPPHPSSEDNFFAEISREADVEFYKMMVVSGNTQTWGTYADMMFATNVVMKE